MECYSIFIFDFNINTFDKRRKFEFDEFVVIFTFNEITCGCIRPIRIFTGGGCGVRITMSVIRVGVELSFVENAEIGTNEAIKMITVLRNFVI